MLGITISGVKIFKKLRYLIIYENILNKYLILIYRISLGSVGGQNKYVEYN